MKTFIKFFIAFCIFFSSVNMLDASINFSKIQIVNTNVWYALGSYNSKTALLKTTNSGLTWILFADIVGDTSSTHKTISDFCFPDVNTGYICGLYNGTGWIAKTINGGITWESVVNPNENDKSAIWFINENVGLVGTYKNYLHPERDIIYQTNNGGLNWFQTQYSAYFDYDISAIRNSDNNTFFALPAYPGILKYINGTPEWSGVIGLSAFDYSPMNSICFMNANTGVVLCPYASPSSGTSLAITMNNGNNWTKIDYDNYQLRSVVTSSDSIYCLKILSGNNKLMKSGTFGLNWTEKNFDIPVTDPFKLDVKSNMMFAINSDPDDNKKLIKSANYGLNWSYVNVPSPTYVITGIVRYSDNNQFVTSGMVKAFKFTNPTGAVTFVDSAEINNDGSYILRNIRTDSLYIGVYPNSTPIRDYVVSYYSETTYWTQAALVRPAGRMRDVNIKVQRLVNTNAVKLTSSNSVSGKVMNIDKTPGNLKDAVLYASNGSTYVGCAITDNNGVYHLQSLPAGNLKIRVDRFGYMRDSTYVTVTPTSNIDSINFYLSRFLNGIREINNSVPDNYLLKQNYPNPFNPSTTIEFAIPKSGYVKLVVYDLLGKEIKTAVNEFKHAGSYVVDLHANDIASGIYFYKLTVNDFTEVKKMLLIK
ncbi:MAG: T9SS type A sorting domain-containing protein [Ignavibacteria bacterium]|nr:T9SS type A sorting domain-containing protein [Ignavibacteria bacterium]